MTTISTNLTQLKSAPANESLAVDVMEAVAAARNVDVMALETTLYEVVDPDALEQLFAPLADGTPRKGGRLVLEIADCEVVVEATGDIEVKRLASADGSGAVSHMNDR